MAKIKANLKYKRQRAPIDQKILKKVITEVGKATAKDIKADVGSFRDTGALYFSIDSKIVDPKKEYRYQAVVGVKNSRYSKETKKGNKTPNRYASKVNKNRRFIQRCITGKDNVVRQLLVQTKGQLIISQ